MRGDLSQDEADLALALILAGSSGPAGRALADGALYAHAALGADGTLGAASATRSSHLAANDIILPIPERAWRAVAEVVAKAPGNAEGQRQANVSGGPTRSGSATIRAAAAAALAAKLEGASLHGAAAIIRGEAGGSDGPPAPFRYRARAERGRDGVTGIAEIRADPVQGWRTIGRSNRFRRGDAEARALRAAERQARSHAAAGGCADPSVEVLRPETESQET